MPPSRSQGLSTRRQLLACAVVGAASTVAYVVWSPGATVRDGRYDLGTNGIWMQHGWLGGDGWFTQYGKEAKKPLFRDPRRLAEAAALLRTLLVNKKELWQQICPDVPFPGEILIAAAQDLPAHAVVRVMASAAAAGYPRTSLMIQKLSSPLR
ncbi:hypothetical protein [Polyangium mundeleinium]|uniref:Uncharacterized protein n=1 Tax=Polyangium mundeleinium TaxID=2995306 RepID=A0ABT5EY38_9BACT|nr:hypothetical protein [Polyangium mundeleinium]MDC0746073.1 hypothetical protein [Polyangium mundeleinium]